MLAIDGKDLVMKYWNEEQPHPLREAIGQAGGFAIGRRASALSLSAPQVQVRDIAQIGTLPPF